MPKSFSQLYKIYDTLNIQEAKASIKSDFVYRLNEISLGTNPTSGGMPPANTPAPPDDANVAASQGYHDFGSGENPPPADAAPQTTDQPGFGSAMLSAGKAALGKTTDLLKKAGGAVDKGINFAATGQTGGDDPQQLASVFMNPQDQESVALIDQLLDNAKVANNPANGQKLLDIISKALGINLDELPEPPEQIQNNSTQITGGLLTDNIFNKGFDAAQKTAGYMKKLTNAVKNVHTATGAGGQTSQIGKFVTGDLQRSNLAKNNAHDLFSVALNKPAALDDHPTFVQFKQQASFKQKQDFLNTLKQLLQQKTGPTA